MDIETQIIISLSSYKIISLLVGLALSYMGYRLFMAGIWGNAGNMESNFGNNKIILKNAAPGTFFVLFGTIIISFTIYKGLEFDQYVNHDNIISSVEDIKPEEKLPNANEIPF